MLSFSLDFAFFRLRLEKVKFVPLTLPKRIVIFLVICYNLTLNAYFLLAILS